MPVNYDVDALNFSFLSHMLNHGLITFLIVIFTAAYIEGGGIKESEHL